VGTSPSFHRVHQGAAHFRVVREVDPTEAGVVRTPCLIGLMVDDGSHAPHDFSFAQSQEIIHVAEIEGCVFLRVERVERVFQKVGHGVRTVLVQFVVEAYERFQLTASRYFFNGYSRHVIYVKWSINCGDAQTCKYSLFFINS